MTAKVADSIDRWRGESNELTKLLGELNQVNARLVDVVESLSAQSEDPGELWKQVAGEDR